VAEGEVVVRHLARSRFCRPVSLLLAEKRVASLAGVIDGLAPGTPVYAATQAVMDAIVGFPIHRGILGLGARVAPAQARDLLAGLPDKAVVLVLCGLANHDNMGGAFRNAAAFGVDAVLVDSDCCDPLYRKSIRVSVGAALITPYARTPAGPGLLDLLEAAGFEMVALSPGGTTRLADLAPPARVAVLLGAEGYGLPETILARTRTVSIPMAQGFDSLNVATTSGIVLHHLTSASP